MSSQLARLSHRMSHEDGHAFELLVNGQPLGQLVGPPHYGPVPLRLVEGQLPLLPGTSEPDISLTIVAVCSCGEYGCGRTACRILASEDRVIFCEFDIDGVDQGDAYEMTFTRADFDRVLEDLLEEAKKVA